MGSMEVEGGGRGGGHRQYHRHVFTSMGIETATIKENIKSLSTSSTLHIFFHFFHVSRYPKGDASVTVNNNKL